MIGLQPRMLIKPYLKKFLLKTHPDYFTNDPRMRKVNEKSLQKLQDILRLKEQCKEDIRISFYKKCDKKLVIGLFEQRSKDWEIAKSFLTLCGKLDIDIESSDMDVVNVMTVTTDHSSRDERQRSLSQEFAEKLYNDMAFKTTTAWTPQAIQRNRLLLFHPDIDKQSIVDKLSKWIPRLKPERWWAKLPILFLPPSIGEPLDGRDEPGIIVLSSDITFEELKEYLAQNLERKLEEYQNKRKSDRM